MNLWDNQKISAKKFSVETETSFFFMENMV